MFDLKPDYDVTRRRIEAFWERQVLDRPVAMFILPRPADEQVPYPADHHPDSAARWLDAQYQAEYALADLLNHDYLGDTLPIACPNLGPELFSALYGCPLHFGDYGTSWTDPCLFDWSEAPNLQLDWQHPYLKALEEITDALLETGRGRFITGMTDWHPGGDAIAAFRDPQHLAVDMIEHRAEVITLLERLEADYFKLYEQYYAKLRTAGMPITAWTPLLSEGRYYIPSNDFSIMISKAMFNEVFLPGLVREIDFYDRSIYHLDGPGALRHLDALLAIPKLDALQFVPGAGNEVFTRWVPVYQKAQAAGKGIQVTCRFEELPDVMQTLDPRGLFLYVHGSPDRDSVSAMLKELERWTQAARR